LVAGAILGTLTKVNDETFGSLGYTYTVISVCKFQTSLFHLNISMLIPRNETSHIAYMKTNNFILSFDIEIVNYT
jgi:hypothetical protein